MAKGKISAKVKGAINTGITLQADDKWCKNSPVAKKFATRVFFNRKWKNAGDLLRSNLQRLLSICKKSYLLVGEAKKVERAFGVFGGRLSELITIAPASGNLILASACIW